MPSSTAYTFILDKLINQLNSSSSIYGSKISGSGLGDCVIGLGQYRNKSSNLLDIKVSDKGMCF